MTVKGGTTPACAACKYQRRKCSIHCPLAPYFPANKPKTFQSVHRLFGVSNVTKTLEKMKTKENKEDAMKSIIYEADMRVRYPVFGCCSVIAHMRHQLQVTIEQLNIIYAHLQTCREQHQHLNNKQAEVDQSSSGCWATLAQFDCGSNSNNDASMAYAKQGMVPANHEVDVFLNDNGGPFNNTAYPLPDTASDFGYLNLNAIQTQMDASTFQEQNTFSQQGLQLIHPYPNHAMSSPESSLENPRQVTADEDLCQGEPRRELQTTANKIFTENIL